METRPILIIASEEDQMFYEDFHLGDEDLLLMTPWQVLENLHQLEADLILLDAGSTPEVGLGVLRDIKPKAPGVPIIFLTAKSSEDIAVRAYKQGVRDYLKKPVPLSSLIDSIQTFLRFKRGSGEKRCFVIRENEDHERYVSRGEPKKNLSAAIIGAIEYVDDNILNKITLEDLCTKANISKFHFSRIFKEQMGMSPMQYVKLRKIEASKRLLADRKMNVSAVAFKIGFNDVSSFIRHFKKIEGKTPYAYRHSIDRLN